jgi:hypothetical protein
MRRQAISTQHPEGPAQSRLAVVQDATERELRLCAFAAVNQYLEMHWMLSEQLGLAPVELLIYLSTSMGNAQRVSTPATLPAVLRDAAALPPKLVVPVSRRAIARLTGLPKETVRRHVESMAARGLLQVSPKGVRATPGALGKPGARRAVRRLVELQAAHTDVLLRLGVVEIRTKRPARGR